MLEKRVVYQSSGVKEVSKRSLIYASHNDVPLTMDIYYPAELTANSQLPAVVFVFGFPNSVILERFGIKLKDSGQYVSWGQLVAASGIIAITYDTMQPEKDIYAILAYVRENAKALQIDGGKLSIWACSGNVPTALSVLVDVDLDLKCAVLYYGLMFDSDGSHEMEELAHRYGCVYPCKTASVNGLSPAIPLFLVRAGKDNSQLNASIERFVSEAIQCNLPLTFVNYSEGQHAFDIEDDIPASHEIIKHTLAFLNENLLKPV